jgi:site-specific DNA-methyltransferase (adenine-specific)
MAVNVEDAGFEIRDQIMWVYGSGFPKSHNLKDEWEGWGTALKPAHEPIVLSRKPFKDTVANNVLEHGTGALNIDGCRVGDDEIKTNAKIKGVSFNSINPVSGYIGCEESTHIGRWPANFIHDGLEEEWSKYFYCPKASKKDREEHNNHPTVKPTELMRYLCRLVTPKNGVVLDPFMGSGSTGKAAILEGFSFTGIELSEEYFNIAKTRIESLNEKNNKE